MASKHEFWIRKSKFEPLLQSFYNPKVTIHKHTLIWNEDNFYDLLEYLKLNCFKRPKLNR